MKNHLGSYECKLCLTLHNNEVGLSAAPCVPSPSPPVPSPVPVGGSHPVLGARSPDTRAGRGQDRRAGWGRRPRLPVLSNVSPTETLVPAGEAKLLCLQRPPLLWTRCSSVSLRFRWRRCCTGARLSPGLSLKRSASGFDGELCGSRVMGAPHPAPGRLPAVPSKPHPSFPAADACCLGCAGGHAQCTMSGLCVSPLFCTVAEGPRPVPTH